MLSLSVHTVQLVLGYISLTDPIPLHLISTPLRQRHHFLQISPSSPSDYLCWPSPDNPTIIRLLDRLSPLPDQSSYPTRYTSDTESTFAHVQISSDPQGLRLVFHWDDTTWRYHNLRLMPFPSPSFSTPQESLANNSLVGRDFPPGPATKVDQVRGDEDDAYWSSYGTAIDGLTSPPPSQSTYDTVAEDAYWAQYASIQGSADSTVPSPLPLDHKLRVVNSSDNGSVSIQDELVIDVPIDAIHPGPQLGPPPPNTLAHLLSTVSPRTNLFLPVPGDSNSTQSASASSTDPPSEQATEDSKLITPPLPDEYLNAAATAVKVNRPPSKHRQRPLETTDKALLESIRGLYCLWKFGRKGEPDEEDRSIFLQIVQEALAYD